MPDDRVHAYLQADDEVVADRWDRLQRWIQQRFGRQGAGIEPILFLIGIQERGQGYEPKLAKEAKQDLIMEGTYHAFAALGFYEQVGMEEDGAWIWERVVTLPKLSVEEQEKLLRLAILHYFDAVLEEKIVP